MAMYSFPDTLRPVGRVANAVDYPWEVRFEFLACLFGLFNYFARFDCHGMCASELTFQPQT